jgi:hypothetical protein
VPPRAGHDPATAVDWGAFPADAVPAEVERAVVQVMTYLVEGRRRRLAYIGFPDDEAAELSALHTRNFM